VSLREAATAFKVGYDWLRRAVTQGVPGTRTGSCITKLAAYFDVPTNSLWEESGEQFRMAVLAKANPDYYARFLTLEAVLRHYGNNRPSLLRKCLDVIDLYRQKIDSPSTVNPEHYFIIVEAPELGESRIYRPSTDWQDEAVAKRLSQLRLLPKREILEEVVQARIARFKRQQNLLNFHSEAVWEHGGAKQEIVLMLIQILIDIYQEDNPTVDDETMAKLTVWAEGYAQKLWDGEYAPGRKAAGPGRSAKKQ
jgi:hypothetical protein